MKLTSEELQHIIPGIYRCTVAYLIPPKVKNVLNDHVAQRLRDTRNEPLDIGKKYPSFFSDPKDFLDAWMKGYDDFPDTNESNFHRHAKGFELYYVNWHRDQKHYIIGSSEGTFARNTRLNHTLLASDINGMNDQSGYMNVGINDFVNERVLVWRSEGRNGGLDIPYGQISRCSKIMRDDISFYVFDVKDKFPFESPNNLKSINVRGQWTLVGLEPESVYEEFQRLGFVFPKV